MGSRRRGNAQRVLVIVMVVAAAAAGLTLALTLWRGSGPHSAIEEKPPALGSSSRPDEPTVLSPAASSKRAARRLTAPKWAAARWAVASATYSYQDPLGPPIEELRPYSTRALIKEMSANSSAGHLQRMRKEKRERARARVRAIQTLYRTPRHVDLLVVLDQATISTAGRKSTLTTIGLRLVRSKPHNRWLVDKVLSP